MIRLKYCQVTRLGATTVTKFFDGTECHSINSGDDYQLQIMGWVGEPDIETYNFKHELTHNFLAEKMWDAASYVIWMEAHGKQMSRVGGLYEERWCYHWLKYANDLGPPLEPEWPEWKLVWDKYLSQDNGPVLHKAQRAS